VFVRSFVRPFVRLASVFARMRRALLLTHRGENVHRMNKGLSVMDTVFQINTTVKADTWALCNQYATDLWYGR